jgi:hypothetical protein
MFPRTIPRTVPDRLNPFMPPRELNLFGEREEDEARRVQVGAVGTGGLKENAGVISQIVVVSGGVIGALAMWKGKVIAGMVIMTAAAIGGAVIDTVAHAGDGKGV